MILARTPADRALRQLFWQLITRGRTAADEKTKKRMGSLTLKLTVVIYAFFGLLPAFSAFVLPPLAFAGLLHGLTLAFASLALAASAGNLLFASEESEILLHRPVHPKQLLQAKAYVIIRYALILAIALNFAGLCTGAFGEGMSWLFIPAHLLSTSLLMVFSAGLTILAYNLCLRWFGRERLDTLLTVVQTLLSIAMIAGSQIAPRLLQNAELFQNFDGSSIWAILLPPVWFGAIDAMVASAMPIGQLWPLATIGVVATVGVAWLAFDRLAQSYGEGLQALGEGAGRGDDRDRRLLAITRWPGLRPWLRDPVERHAFVLGSAYLLRDRETKLKIYPGLAPLLVMPLVLLGLGESMGEKVAFLDYMMLTYLVIVPIQPLVFLRHTAHYRAADLFRASPLAHWAPLYHGIRKATLFWLAVPSTIILVGIMFVIRGSFEVLLAAVPVIALLPVYSLLPGAARSGKRADWLPLSRAPEDMQSASLGCMFMGLTMGSAFGVAAVGGLLAGYGYALPFAAGMIVVSLLLQRALARGMLARPWNPTQS